MVDMSHIIEHWISPAGVMIIIGAIIWGVQLNFAVMRLSNAVGITQQKIDEHRKEMLALISQLNKTAIILDMVEKRMEQFESYRRDHEKESNDWKQKIVKLEERLSVNGFKR